MSIRVLVVDDSSFFRRRLTEILAADREGYAANRGFAKIRADGSYLQLFVILLCFISSRRISI